MYYPPSHEHLLETPFMIDTVCTCSVGQSLQNRHYFVHCARIFHQDDSHCEGWQARERLQPGSLRQHNILLVPDRNIHLEAAPLICEVFNMDHVDRVAMSSA